MREKLQDCRRRDKKSECNKIWASCRDIDQKYWHCKHSFTLYPGRYNMDQLLFCFRRWCPIWWVQNERVWTRAGARWPLHVHSSQVRCHPYLQLSLALSLSSSTYWCLLVFVLYTLHLCPHRCMFVWACRKMNFIHLLLAAVAIVHVYCKIKFFEFMLTFFQQPMKSYVLEDIIVCYI